MSSKSRDGNSAGGRMNRRSRPGRIWGFVGTTVLMSFVSCSSDTLPGSGDGGEAGSSTAAGAANRSGASGQAGSVHGGAPGSGGAGSGLAGDDAAGGDAAGGDAAGGDAAGGDAAGGDAAGGGSEVSGASGSGELAGRGGGASGIGGGGASGIGGGGASGIGGGGASGIGGGGASGIGGGGASGIGGAAGAGGGQGSFTISSTFLTVSCTSPAVQTETITNTSSVPLTWHLSGDLSGTLVTPLGSTIPPGGSVDVSFSPKLGVPHPGGVLSIDADVAPSQTIYILGGYNETTVDPPADIDFGNVPLQGPSGVDAPKAYISTSTAGVSSGLTISSNPTSAFELNGLGPAGIPGGGLGWTVTFKPQSLGPKEATISYIKLNGTVCPPNSFKVRGVGISP